MELAAALQKEIDQRKKELDEKLYIVEGGEEAGKKLLDFITNKAQWKFTEAMGIIEMTKEIQTAIENAKGGKELFLRTLPLEALWFFINKVEGVGLAEAKDYHYNLVHPVGQALSRVKGDRDQLNELQMRQGSLEAGADFEEDPKARKQQKQEPVHEHAE